MDERHKSYLDDSFKNQDYINNNISILSYRLKEISKRVKGKNILDIGYANAHNPYLKGKVIGLDLAKAEKPHNYIKVIEASCYNMPFKNKSFDTVILGEVLEHLDNPSKCIEECSRILKIGGRLIITIPNPFSFNNIIKRLILRKKYLEHANYISELAFYQIETLLENNNIKLIEEKGISISLPILARFDKKFRNVPYKFLRTCTSAIYIGIRIKYSNKRQEYLKSKVLRAYKSS